MLVAVFYNIPVNESERAQKWVCVIHVVIVGCKWGGSHHKKKRRHKTAQGEIGGPSTASKFFISSTHSITFHYFQMERGERHKITQKWPLIKKKLGWGGRDGLRKCESDASSFSLEDIGSDAGAQFPPQAKRKSRFIAFWTREDESSQSILPPPKWAIYHLNGQSHPRWSHFEVPVIKYGNEYGRGMDEVGPITSWFPYALLLI